MIYSLLKKKVSINSTNFFNEIDGDKILFSLDVSESNLRIKEWQEINVAGVITNVVHQIRSRTQHKYAA